MNPTPPQQLVRQILEIAMRLAEMSGPAIAVEFNSGTNHLRVTAKQQWAEPPVIDECIELSAPGSAPFTKKRIDQRLREVITKLNAMLISNDTPPRPAA